MPAVIGVAAVWMGTHFGPGVAIGLGISGSGLIPGVYNERKRCAFKTGEKAVELVNKKITARKIMTWEAIENTIITDRIHCNYT